MRTAIVSVSLALGAIGLSLFHGPGPQSPHPPKVPSKAHADAMLQRQAACFVPNLGQWNHRARFVHRSGPMTVFLEDRGWTLDLVERPARPKAGPHEPGSSVMHQAMPGDGEVDQQIRGVALKMTFEGDSHVPEILGEKKLSGHHNYFLGNDESRWRSGVPLYASVRYEDLYPGIDLRLREMNGVPEYDLLLQPGADLSLVNVHVEGAKRLSIARDGALVIETVLGPLTQSIPKTWEVGADGRKRDVVCNFTLLGPQRFGFLAPSWDGDTSLTIDPALIWSTFLGGRTGDYIANSLSVDPTGVVTVAGGTGSTNFPTTLGAYDRTFNGNYNDAFVSRLDPRKTGSAQLVYSTFLGGSKYESATALFVDASGVVTVGGFTQSTNFPTTSGAFDRTYNGLNWDCFVARLIPLPLLGSNQLVYSTFLGGSRDEQVNALSADASGVVTVVGYTPSTDFPTTAGAYDRTHNGGYSDAFVSRLDPSKTGNAQLTYSTFLGGSQSTSGNGGDGAAALSVDASGVVTVAGYTASSNFPTTSGAYRRSVSGVGVFVSRLDPGRTGNAQLVYSTFLGHGSAYALWVDVSGVVTVAGQAQSGNFPTTSGAYDTTFKGRYDGFVSRLVLVPALGSKQLVYSTFLGGSGWDYCGGLAVDAIGMVTVTGATYSSNFPTTSGAYDTTFNGGSNIVVDAFVSQLDLSKSGSAQLVYSSFLGGGSEDYGHAVSVDPNGVATVAGITNSFNFPTSNGAYDTTPNGSWDVFVCRLAMGATLYGDVHEVSISTGGAQKLTLDAGKAHASRSYWIFGSVTGTTPGVTLASAIGSVNIPLNPDIWTTYTIALANTATLTNTKATLDITGTAQASFNIPKVNLPSAIGVVFHHAYLVYDARNNFYMASNPVPLKLVK